MSKSQWIICLFGQTTLTKYWSLISISDTSKCSQSYLIVERENAKMCYDRSMKNLSLDGGNHVK